MPLQAHACPECGSHAGEVDEDTTKDAAAGTGERERGVATARDASGPAAVTGVRPARRRRRKA